MMLKKCIKGNKLMKTNKHKIAKWTDIIHYELTHPKWTYSEYNTEQTETHFLAIHMRNPCSIFWPFLGFNCTVTNQEPKLDPGSWRLQLGVCTKCNKSNNCSIKGKIVKKILILVLCCAYFDSFFKAFFAKCMAVYCLQNFRIIEEWQQKKTIGPSSMPIPAIGHSQNPFTCAFSGGPMYE